MPDSPVFVTANYRLSYDALRSALTGIDAYILVLNTLGINVWCAAGKGTFGTDELVERIGSSALGDVVHHRVLIVPQLGASGVAAHEVKRRAGFTVRYGPIRAADLPAYLRSQQASPAMRQVWFPLRDRIVLIPVELVHVVVPLCIAAIILLLLLGPLAAAAAVTAVLAGTVLFPILLPWLPTRDFSSQGYILGVAVMLPFAFAVPSGAGGQAGWRAAGWAAVCLLTAPPVTAYLALNFTGSTTFTSVSGGGRELRTYIPILAGMAGAGVVLAAVLLLSYALGG